MNTSSTILRISTRCQQVVRRYSSNSLRCEDIPKPKGISILQLIKEGGPSYLHRHVDAQHATLGPIFRQTLGSTELIFVADANLFELVIRNEGKYPHHSVPPVWEFYNEIKNIQRGLFFMRGQKWSDTRRFMNKVFLEPKNFERRIRTRLYLFNDAINDLFARWTKKRSEDGSILIENLKNDLDRWSIESTGIILFDRRLDCLNDANKESLELIRSVNGIFETTSTFQIVPPKLAWALNLSVWKKFDRHMTTSIELARSYVDRSTTLPTKKEQSKSYKVSGEHLDSTSIAQDMLLYMNDKQVVVQSVVDLIIAATDTTANAVQWALYLLSKNPSQQEKIFHESKAITGDRLPDLGNIIEMSYTDACIKEALRLYPIAPFIARTLDSNIKLYNYELPAGKTIIFSLLTTSRDEKYFGRAQEFCPERWLNTSSDRTTSCPMTRNRHASLPFGKGLRSCIGRRMAELQMRLLISRIVTNFNIEPVIDDNIDIKLRMVTTPERKIDLRLIPRHVM